MGAAEAAMHIWMGDKGFIHKGDSPLQAFDCAGGNYKEGTEIIICHNEGGDNQKF